MAQAETEWQRSYVHPFTNQIVLTDFDPASYLQWLSGRRVEGSAVLANFLHEWTHRWCFHSIVGSAVSLVKMRAATRHFVGRSAFDDYVRCMTAARCLEPFAEGLALFAEFDTCPGKSPWLSQTLTATSHYFAPALNIGPIFPLEALLQELRRDPALLERKAGIYALSASNPYLRGYLSVKSLWRQMAAACDALNDRDLFLSYLRSYIYDDPGMVLAILSPAYGEIRAAERITNHLISRARDLLSFSELSERVDRWLESAEKGRVDAKSIGTTDHQSAEAASLLTQAWIEDVSDDQTETLAAWTLMTMEERTICLIGVARVFLRSTVGPRVDVALKADGPPIYTTEAIVAQQSDVGELFIFGTGNGQGMLVLLRIKEEVSLISSFGAHSDDELSLAKRHIMNKLNSESLHEELRARVASSAVASTVWKIIAPQVDAGLDAIYGPLCTLNASDDRWHDALAQLQKMGVFSLLDEDAELTRAIAAIGLVNTVSFDVGTICTLVTALGVDESAVDQALSLGPRYGMQLIARQGWSAAALV
jgi:hypothetical protein